MGGEKPIAVKVSKYRRLDPQSVVSDAKICGYYVNSIFASLDAQRSGFNEALLLDSEGYLAEGPGENIFIVKKEELSTPSVGSILPGITRDSAIKIAKDLGIEVKEKKIILEELKLADEAFFTGTAVEICPIGKIDKTLIGNGETGKITEEIKSLYQRIIHGKEKKYLHWLTFIK